MTRAIRFNRRRAPVVAAVGVVLSALIGCSGGGAATSGPTGAASTPQASTAGKQWTMGFSQIGLTGPFLVGDSYGVVDEAKKLGINMVFLEAGGFGGLQKQISNTENLIQQKVDALLLDPISDEALKPLVQKAVDAKIPVVGVGDPITHPGVAAAVTSSHTDIGNAMGDAAIADAKGAQMKVVILAGPPGAQWTTLREKAFEDKIKAAGNFEIKTVQWFDEVTRSKGLALTEDFLRTFPDANLFYAADNAIGLGVADAVKTAGKAGQVKIVTSVVDNDTVQMIKDGVITMDVAQQVVLIGREGVRVALRVLNGETINPKDVIIPVVTITKDNIGQVNLETMIAPEGWKP
jgi:ribose transport system substrate-binding protein/inositol transport system substrate-binding protein